MELRHLRNFLAVAEDLHFKRAAERLHISQPPLTRSIRQLEQEIGAALLVRTTRKVELTEAGKNFADEVRQILARLSHAATQAAQVGNGIFGQLVVGYTPARAHIVAQSVKLFTKHYPNIHILLRDMSGQGMESIRDRRVDVGFLSLPQNTADLIVEPLLRERFIVAMATTHPLAKRRTVLVSDLANTPNLLFPRTFNPSGYDLIVSLFQRKGLTMNITLEVETMPMRLALVEAGLGVTIIRESSRKTATAGIVFRPLQNSPVVELGIAFNRDNQSPAVPLFVSVVREDFRGVPLK